MRRFPILMPVAAALLVAGCTVGPDYRRPATPGESGTWLSPADQRPIAADPWAALGDPALDRLIVAARTGNLDIREAEARLREARALRDAAAGRALPKLDGAAFAQQQQITKNGQFPVARIPGFTPNYSLFDLGFDASWELDLWGGTRRSIEANARQVEAASARIDAARLQVTAEIVRSYARLRAGQAALASARSDADAQAKIAALVRQRYQAGEAALSDDARAQRQSQTAAAAVPELEADVRANADALALLVGEPPEAVVPGLLAAAPLPTLPDDVGVGLRADLLRRRPDIRAAEADLAAATANIGVETANLFPKISLVGGLGQQSRTLGNLFSADSTRFQIGPQLRWAIFDAGRIRAQIRAADARADQAAARYTKAILTALADSETAINRYAAALATVRERDAARASSATALDLARQRFRAGEDDRVQLLNAESDFTAADRAAMAARGSAVEAYAALIKALGGGWESPASSAMPS